MKSLVIDFAPPSLARTLRRIGAITWLMTGVGLLACLSMAVKGYVLLEAHAANQDAFAKAVAQQRSRSRSAPVPQKKNTSAAEAVAVNAAIGQLNIPWRDLLDAIEHATPSDNALLSLEPDAAKHRLKVSAEAKDSAAMIGYIGSLRQQTFFQDIDLLHHEIIETDVHKPLRFQFEARWLENPS